MLEKSLKIFTGETLERALEATRGDIPEGFLGESTGRIRGGIFKEI